MTLQDELIMALDKLRDFGWIKGSLRKNGYCALGAIHSFSGNGYHWSEISEFLYSVILEQYPRWNNMFSIANGADLIPKWNDAEERTWEEVEAIFEKAIARAGEEGL